MKARLFLFSALIAVILTACNKDKSSNSYPKDVRIEYRYTVASGTPDKVDVSFTNESGGTETLINITLPFSKEIHRTVNRGDDVSTLFIGFGPGGVKGEIYIDGKLVDAKTASSNDPSRSFNEVMSYSW